MASEYQTPVAETDRALGQHLLIDYHECRNLPATPQQLQRVLEQAARLIGATVVQSVFHEFNPYGLSGVVVVAESHLAVHTWPEFNAACVDFFTCAVEMEPRKGLEFLASEFQATSYDTKSISRGNGHLPPSPKET